MQGKGPHTILTYMYFRITPAYAGKSWQGCYHQGHHEDHPRICGEKSAYSRNSGRTTGITPAYAGKRHRSLLSCATTPDHSRICGEKISLLRMACSPMGSPPHIRGKGNAKVVCQRAHGITPAYAGKRCHSIAGFAVCGDHPRICGEKTCPHRCRTAVWGSPPHMRGKVLEEIINFNQSRITPAYAGKSILSDALRAGS